MKNSNQQLLKEDVSPAEQDHVLNYLNARLTAVGAKAIFRNHFIDRLNDKRNKEVFTREVFLEIVNKLLAVKNLKKLQHMKDGQEGVMIYRSFNFVYTLENVRGQLQLRFITAMSKDKFKSNNPKDFILRLESFREFYKNYASK